MTEQQYPLHAAVLESDEEEARNLILGDANLSEFNDDDWSPLHLCAQTNNERIARWLINAGAKTNLKNSKGVTPLHSCAWTNSSDVAKFLLKNGANPNLKDDSSWTPMMLAAWCNHYNIIELFVQNGASINARSKTGSTALHFAAYNNAPLAVETLLENKASVNIVNDENFTAHDLAVRKKNAECIVKLEAHSAIDPERSRAASKMSNAPIVVKTEDYFQADVAQEAPKVADKPKKIDTKKAPKTTKPADTAKSSESPPPEQKTEPTIAPVATTSAEPTPKKTELPQTAPPLSQPAQPPGPTTITEDIITKDSFFLDAPEDDMPFITELTKEQSRLSSDGYTSEILFPEQLVNITFNGEKMRRKSEVVIANLLFSFDINYVYERKLCGTVAVGINYPAFSIFTPDDRIIIWEHISGLNNPDKRKQFNQLKRWYKLNGFIENENFFTTQDTTNGGVDSPSILAVAEKVQQKLDQIVQEVSEDTEKTTDA